MENDQAYPKEMWWHHHPVFLVDDKGISRTRSGQEREYDNAWEYRERAAWTYELVRRLGTMVEDKLPIGLPIPSAAMMENLAGLVPYNKRAGSPGINC